MGLREEKKQEQRQAILDAARQLFCKRGYEQTRVRDIVARLRISEATFFNYFPTKEALLYEFALEQLDLSAESLKALLEARERSVPDRIRNLIRSWAGAWEADRELNALVVTRSRMLTGPRGPLLDKELNNYQLLAALFAEGQRRGEIRTDATPIQLAEMLQGLWGLIGGNWLVGWWKNDSEPLTRRAMRAVEIFLDGCRPPSGKSPSTRRAKSGARK